MWEGTAVQTADEKYPELRRAIKLLAKLDPDRAREQNGVGFNGTDGQFGHSLASQERWSPKQANAAYEMLRKYHRQLESFGVSWSSIPRPQVPTEGGAQPVPAPRPKPTRQVIVAPDGRFGLKFSYDEGLLFKLKQHFRNRFWDKENKIWLIGNNEEDIEALTRWVAENDFEYSETAARALEGLQSVKGSRVEASKAATSDFDVLGMGGSLRPFQIVASVYALSQIDPTLNRWKVSGARENAERGLQKDSVAQKETQSLGIRKREDRSQDQSQSSGIVASERSNSGFQRENESYNFRSLQNESIIQKTPAGRSPQGSEKSGRIELQMGQRARPTSTRDSDGESDARISEGSDNQNEGPRDTAQTTESLQSRFGQSTNESGDRVGRSESSTQKEVRSKENRSTGGPRLEGLAPAPLKQNERIRVLIADEPGTGKTIEALSIIHLTESFPALIVCPASLKLNWARETRKWLRDKTVNVITDEQIKGDVVIINYDRLKKYYDLLITMQFKIIVFDESHALKNHKAQRSKLSAELAKSIQSIILLTGSPVMNRPIELVHQLGVMGKLNEFGGFWAFAKKYCGAQKERYGWNMTGATNLAELNTKLRASCFIRRLKVDVLSELPPKVRSTLPLPLDNMDTYEKAEEELINWIAENYGHAKAEKAKQAEALVRISTLKKLAVQGKMAAIKDWVESFLETDQKLILFAWHQDVIERLHREFPDSVVLTGQTPLEERQKAVDQFQNDPACKLFIGNIQAGGLGITLTAASNVAFVELGWNPSTHNQAEDRAHRIGQNDSVTAYYLIGENTIDEEILALIEAKRKVVDAATEGKVLEEGAFIDELMQKMLERHGRVKTAPVAVEEVEEDNWF